MTYKGKHKGVDFEIASKKEKIWIDLKDNANKALEQYEKELEVNKEIIKMCDRKLKEISDAEKSKAR